MDPELQSLLTSISDKMDALAASIAEVKASLSDVQEIASVFQQFGAMMDSGQASSVPMLSQ